MSQDNELLTSSFEVEPSGNAKLRPLSEREGSCCRKMVSRKAVVIAAVAVVGVTLSFVVGYLVRRAVHKPTCSSSGTGSSGATGRPMVQREKDWDIIVKKIVASNIDANVK